MEDLKILLQVVVSALLSFLAWRRRRAQKFRLLYGWARRWEEKTWARSRLSEADERLSLSAAHLARRLETMGKVNILFADFDALYERCVAESGEWGQEGGEVISVGARKGKGKMLERRRTFNGVFLQKKAYLEEVRREKSVV